MWFYKKKLCLIKYHFTKLSETIEYRALVECISKCRNKKKNTFSNKSQATGVDGLCRTDGNETQPVGCFDSQNKNLKTCFHNCNHCGNKFFRFNKQWQELFFINKSKIIIICLKSFSHQERVKIRKPAVNFPGKDKLLVKHCFGSAVRFRIKPISCKQGVDRIKRSIIQSANGCVVHPVFHQKPGFLKRLGGFL